MWIMQREKSYKITMEKLTAFLEEEKNKFAEEFFSVKLNGENRWRLLGEPVYVEKWQEDHDQRLITTLLDIVWEEIEKKKYGKDVDELVYIDDIKQILTNLKK